MIGFILISCGIVTQVYQVIKSIKQRKQNMDLTGDPWNGRTLEWTTHSPPPFYNFAVIPPITSHEAFWDMKKEGWRPDKKYQDIECFKNTGMGIYISVLPFLLPLPSSGRLFGSLWSAHRSHRLCLLPSRLTMRWNMYYPRKKLLKLKQAKNY